MRGGGSSLFSRTAWVPGAKTGDTKSEVQHIHLKFILLFCLQIASAFDHWNLMAKALDFLNEVHNKELDPAFTIKLI